MPEAPRGRFIAFEGGEGTGKSTQARILADRLGALLTREPGGTGLGERIRHLVLDTGADAVGTRAEALLFAAARAQHVDEVIAPSLAAGRHVVTDRFVHSSIAYQATAGGSRRRRSPSSPAGPPTGWCRISWSCSRSAPRWWPGASTGHSTGWRRPAGTSTSGCARGS